MGVAGGAGFVAPSVSTACCSPPLEKLMRVGRLLAMVYEVAQVVVMCLWLHVMWNRYCAGGRPYVTGASGGGLGATCGATKFGQF